MSLTLIILTAFGLAMDAFAVSIVNGCALKNKHYGHHFKIAFSFGFFQAVMPFIGWYSGNVFSGFFREIDHWIAFILLLFIGIKMIREGTRSQNRCEKPSILSLNSLLLLSIATSIDALAIGFSLSCLQISIMKPIIIIGVITFILSLIGLAIGEKIGHFFENKIESLGGVLLIIIGIKILMDHLFY